MKKNSTLDQLRSFLEIKILLDLWIARFSGKKKSFVALDAGVASHLKVIPSLNLICLSVALARTISISDGCIGPTFAAQW